jgi:pyruvate kinase
VVYQPAQIGCSLSDVFTDARPGERIFFDDGRIGGVIRAARRDTRLRVSALTPKDRQDLEFAAEYGDLVSLSFVRRPEDVAELIEALDSLGADQTGII